MICPEELSAALEATFVAIQRERMADVPILNPALKVEAVGFRAWDGYCLGVLVTPWFMNFMLLPGNRDEWAGLPSGTRINHVFPSGNYEFILGEEERIGRYQMCSLFSPVFEFQDQEAAVVIAEAVMEGLMDEGNRDGTPTNERGKMPTPEEVMARPMSRRDWLRGRFSSGH